MLKKKKTKLQIALKFMMKTCFHMLSVDFIFIFF